MKNLLNRLYRNHRTSIVGALFLLVGIALMYAPLPVAYDTLQDILVTTFVLAGLAGLGLRDQPKHPETPTKHEKRPAPPAAGGRFSGRAE